MDNTQETTEKEQKYTSQDLKIMQSWPLERKIQVTLTKIIEFCEKFDNKIYDLLHVNSQACFKIYIYGFLDYHCNFLFCKICNPFCKFFKISH